MSSTDASDVAIAFIKSPVAIIVTLALVAWVGHVFNVPGLDEIVPALAELKEFLVPGGPS